jgi:colanic acid/amylovoran biosynthesis glycosyltransferase
MLTVAHLANQFPAAVEPYVSDQIEELRRRGVCVVASSVRTPDLEKSALANPSDSDVLCLQSLRMMMLLRGLWLALSQYRRISGPLARVMRGEESLKRRLRALLHTALGAYYAALLKDRGVHHIHVHHGYLASWIGMVAARLLGIDFSLTLYGSDLLLNAAYLDTKLENCLFCVTISDYNRRYILRHFSEIDARKIVVSRLGVDVPQSVPHSRPKTAGEKLQLLAVGRLHPVKDHAVLIHACTLLRDAGIDFQCTIVGKGPERERLETLIRQSCLQDRLLLFGYATPQQLDSLYSDSDVVVLTSRSEGIPLVLMEAMARGKIVLAPAITGIPEIVIPGKTGFLYAPGVLDDFVAKILLVRELMLAEPYFANQRLDWIRHAARLQILHNFNRAKNLARFADQFLLRIAAADSSPTPITQLSIKRIPPGRISSADILQPGWEPPA